MGIPGVVIQMSIWCHEIPVFHWNIRKLIQFTSSCLRNLSKMNCERRKTYQWNTWLELVFPGSCMCRAWKGRGKPWLFKSWISCSSYCHPESVEGPCWYTCFLKDVACLHHCSLGRRHKSLEEGETELGLYVCSGEIFLICYLCLWGNRKKGFIHKLTFMCFRSNTQQRWLFMLYMVCICILVYFMKTRGSVFFFFLNWMKFLCKTVCCYGMKLYPVNKYLL